MRAAVRVVGMRAGGREHVVAHVREGDPVLVVPEPDNPHDPHAIAVYTAPRRSLLYPHALTSSVTCPDRVGTVDDYDRLLLMDRQAGYLPADVAATLQLPASGIVGWVSTVRNGPPAYNRFGAELPPTPAGFDVTCWWPTPIQTSAAPNL